MVTVCRRAGIGGTYDTPDSHTDFSSGSSLDYYAAAGRLVYIFHHIRLVCTAYGS